MRVLFALALAGFVYSQKAPTVITPGETRIGPPSHEVQPNGPLVKPLSRLWVLELRNIELTISLLQRQYQDVQEEICKEAGIELARCAIDAKAQTPTVSRVPDVPAPKPTVPATEAKP